MHRSVLVMNSVVFMKFHGYRPNFEAEKRIIKVGSEKNLQKIEKLHSNVKLYSGTCEGHLKGKYVEIQLSFLN